MTTDTHYVYRFGATCTQGTAAMKNLLGGKGANLAEMCRLGITVPSGFTISTEACTVFTEKGRDHALRLIEAEVLEGVAYVELEMGKRFGNAADPLLLSVRSGARASMPGMMDTILNLGLNDEAVIGLALKSGNERFAWDSYRRFVQMYGDVVMGLKPVSKEDHDPFEVIIDMVKEARGVQLDSELDTADLKELVTRFQGLIRARIGRDFPVDPWEQLWGAVVAVFESWNNDRAKVYRELNDIPQSWGTAVNIQAMVFGNLGDSSATGVAFSRDAGTGEDLFNGEFLVNAQGEDVVAGIRTPQQVSLVGSRRWAGLALVPEDERRSKFPSLEELMPDIFKQLMHAETTLENHFKDMQDMEFTIQQGKLWMLQTRNGKRTGAAMVRIAMEMLQQGMLDEKAALQRVSPDRLNDLLHPIFDPKALKESKVIARPAGVAGRGYRADRLLRRRGRGMGQAGSCRDPRAPGNLARRPARHERGQGHPHRAGGHDIARRGGGARHGQVLRVGCRCGARRLQGAHDDDRRQGLRAGRMDLAQRFHWRGLRGSTGDQGRRAERRLRRPDGADRPLQAAGDSHQCRHPR